MIYIYNCYGGTHSSSLASAIHLGRLTTDRLPTREEILGTAHFNELTRNDMGSIIFRGIDDQGNRVYSMGRGTSRAIIPCVTNLINLLNKECGLKEKIVLSNMSPAVPPFMTFGGMFSRWLRIHFIGVPMLLIGTRQTFYTIAELVRLTKERAAESDAPVTVIDNTEDVKRINRELKRRNRSKPQQ